MTAIVSDYLLDFFFEGRPRTLPRVGHFQLFYLNVSNHKLCCLTCFSHIFFGCKVFRFPGLGGFVCVLDLAANNNTNGIQIMLSLTCNIVNMVLFPPEHIHCFEGRIRSRKSVTRRPTTGGPKHGMRFTRLCMRVSSLSLCSYAFWVYLGRSKTDKSLQSLISRIPRLGRSIQRTTNSLGKPVICMFFSEAAVQWYSHSKPCGIY